MRVLHVGNIANNGYNNAKFLRRKGVEADVLCYDYTHVMGQPEWEDAEFDAEIDEFEPNWEEVDLGGFTRPDWFITGALARSVPYRKQLFKGQFRLKRMLLQQPALWGGAWAKYVECSTNLSTKDLSFLDVLRVYPKKKRFEEWFQGYDLIQAYALDPVHAWMFGGGRPYVAFEHGTMRDIPFEQNVYGRLLGMAYRMAGKVVITNPDVITAARRLGLMNFVFIPHPVDETKYCPRDSTMRGELENRYQTDLICFAPSRHNWALKGNDLLIRAFAQLLNLKRGKPILVLCEWGQEIERSRRLIQDLGIQGSVVWVRPLNKMRLINFYNASDLVLDQFTVGTFGTVTPEAMACGKPVIMHFDRQVHDWCYSEMPPVITANTQTQIFEAMMRLGSDAGLRATLGVSAREWIEKYHGWQVVAEKQISIYRELLQR